MSVDYPIPQIKVAEDDVRETRYAICKDCDKMTKYKVCSECLCIIPIKVVWAESSCPLGKWGKVVDAGEN